MAENILLHLKHKIESLLFSAARKLSVNEIKKLTRSSEEDILKCLHDYKRELEEKGSSLVLEKDGEYWQLTVKEQYIPVIKKVVTQTEMPKTTVETLAVVAYNAPVLQSRIIKIRTNKAYKHLDWLEKEGFISREKKGRTKLIRLTPKFYDYFNLDPRQVKQKFKEIAEAKGKEIELPEGVEEYADKLGELTVYERDIKTKTAQTTHTTQAAPAEHTGQTTRQAETKKTSDTNQEIKENKPTTEPKEKIPEKGLELTPEQEKKADEKVREMLGLKDDGTENISKPTEEKETENKNQTTEENQKNRTIKGQNHTIEKKEKTETEQKKEEIKETDKTEAEETIRKKTPEKNNAEGK